MSVNTGLTVWEVATLKRARGALDHGRSKKSMLLEVYFSHHYILEKSATTALGGTWGTSTIIGSSQKFRTNTIHPKSPSRSFWLLPVLPITF